MDLSALISFVIVLAILLFLISTAIKIIPEYERAVIFRLGRVQKVKGPGLIFLIPFVDRAVRVDLRVVTMDVPSQEAITRDNVTVKVNAVVYFRVVEPSSAVVNVEDYRRATWNIAQTTLRNVLGQSELDELLAHRERINQKLQQIIDEATEPWGIKVGIVEVKDVELPETMKRSMAKQAEAEREKRAKIIHASGEFEAAQQLREAAHTMAHEPIALQLRYLSTLVEISAEKNSTIIFPFPLEFVRAFSALMENLTGVIPSDTSDASDDSA
ncbi:MAG: slipin family protein [Anaerolineae bacterium]|nr:slipin family protein [Anaerolineae bacterium]